MDLKRLLELAGVPQTADTQQLNEAKDEKTCACGCAPDKCKCEADCKKCSCNAKEEQEECEEEECEEQEESTKCEKCDCDPCECKEEQEEVTKDTKEEYDFGSLKRLRFLAGLTEAAKYDEPKANHTQKLGGKKCKDPKEGKGKSADSGKYNEPKANNKVKSGGDSVKSKEGKLKVPSKSKYTDHNSTK